MGEFVDTEKVYDVLWKEGLMIKLYDAGVPGRILNWIRDFLKSRTVQVRVGETVSGEDNVDNGTPPGTCNQFSCV